MKKTILSIGTFFFGALLFACASKTVPTQKLVPPEISTQETIATEKMTWEMQWEKVLIEARKEGRVVIYGPSIAEVRQGYVDNFQKAYPGITVEYTGMESSPLAARVLSERRAGIYLTDIYQTGTIAILTELRQAVVPIKPFLIRPEVKDPTLWLGGKLEFADDAEEINLVFTINVNSRVVYNTELVDPREIVSWWDLTKPKWKEKIVMRDPRTEGTGSANALFWYNNPTLGLDYIKALAANKPIITRDARLQTEWVARGKYAILLGPRSAEVANFAKEGLPIKFADYMKEGTYGSSATGSVAIADRAPHPNAASVFLNWLLGKEGQTVWTKASNYASLLLSAPTDHLLAADRPKPGVQYDMSGNKEAGVAEKVKVMEISKEIFKGF